MKSLFKQTSLLSYIVIAVVLSLTVPAMAARPDSFADLVEEHGDTVVNIYTTQTVKESRVPQFGGLPDHPEIPDFFKRFFDNPNFRGQKQPGRSMKRTSLGSGVITSADGYIITNNHVIEEADEINVRFANHEEYEAKIIGRDPKTDIALIKIEPKEDLPYVALGDSDSLRVGDWVVAIGNPFGFEQTVTAGIVSGKGRHLGSGAYENFIQTDASINPGNSGGPLFNLQGEMVGINTAIYSRSGGNIGIGFAIPVNMAKNVTDQLKNTGKVTRGWLGVMIQNVNQDLAEQFGLDKPIGALVGGVSPDSPAEKAGIQAGDIITKFDKKEITQMNMLPAIVAQTPVGEEVKVTLFRDGKKEKVKVTIGKLKEEEISPEAEQESAQLGLSVQELTPELAKSLKLKDENGVIVSNVEQGSAASIAGLRRGDLVLEANRQDITNMDDYSKVMEKLKDEKSILFLIKRKNHTKFVVVETE